MLKKESEVKKVKPSEVKELDPPHIWLSPDSDFRYFKNSPSYTITHNNNSVCYQYSKALNQSVPPISLSLNKAWFLFRLL